MMGRAKKITITKDDTIILDGSGDKTAIGERCDQIREAIAQSQSDYDRSDNHYGLEWNCIVRGCVNAGTGFVPVLYIEFVAASGATATLCLSSMLAR